MPYIIGIALAFVVCEFARRVRLDRDGAFYPTMLVVVASYYVLFAAMGASLRIAAIEIGIMAAFMWAAAIGFKRSLWIVVAGLAAHGGMDAFHGLIVPNPGVPVWWPAFCLSFDVTAAIVLASILNPASAASSLITNG